MMRFEPELTARIKKYKDAVFFQGQPGSIRWMIHDKDGTHVYCDKCGNIANGVLYEPVERYELKVPLCRTHLQKWMADHPTFHWYEWALVLADVNRKRGGNNE